MLISWSSDLETGVATIDCGLRAIVDQINEAAMVAAWGKDTAAVAERLQKLAFLFQHQFIKEQGLMAMAVYPYYVEHRNEHEEFLTAFRAMIAPPLGGRLRTEGAVSFALKFILGRHRAADARLAEFLALNAHYRRPSYMPLRTLGYTLLHRI